MLASNLLSCRPACCNSTSVVPEVSCTLDALHVFPGHLCGKGGVALLPEELARADEGRGVLELPAHHVRPLVEPQRQIPVAADPLRSSKDPQDHPSAQHMLPLKPECMHKSTPFTGFTPFFRIFCLAALKP